MSRMQRTDHRDARSVVGSLIVLATVVFSIDSPGAMGAPGDHPRVRVIAPGVTLTTMVDQRIPRRAYIFTIDPSQGATLDVTLADDQIPGLEPTSSMARRSGAIAAVNGDFGFTSGRPVHPFVLDGVLGQTSQAVGAALAILSDGSMVIGKPKVAVSATEADTGETWAVGSWNHGRPRPGELTASTAIGASLETRPFDCSARLVPAADPVPTDVGWTRDYAVDVTACRAQTLSPGDGVLLSGEPGTDEGTFVRSLSLGETIGITWTFGWPGVVDAVGGSHLLVEDGRVALGSCTGAVCSPHPRTALGLTADGRVLLVVVDGRRSTASGMSLIQFAQFLVSLGAESAINVDGGGSSTAVVKGRVVNDPSDGRERSVAMAVLVKATR
jgi:phosphodiester glycosidase